MDPSPPRILATDDRPEILRLIDRTLGRRYACEFAGSVAEAREKLANGDFQLALCDIQMPGESGLALAEEIAASDADVAVVLVTGEDDPEIARKAFGFGVHGYLVKPFRPGQLLITTMNALRRIELEIAARRHVRTLEERLQTIVERAPMPIFVKDSSHRYIVLNRPADELVGAGENPVGRTAGEVFSVEAGEEARATDEAVLQGGETFDFENTLTIDGEERSFRIIKFPLLGHEGEIAAVCGIATDITAHKEAARLNDELAAAQQRAIADLRRSRRETVERLAKAIEMHDASTGEHVNRMAAVAALLASKLGLARERVELLRVAAPMHDVGKIATPDQILRKPGALTPEERVEMERHTVVGHEILAGSGSDLLELAAAIALTHHERFDGKGYPNGLAGEAIPIEGRVTAVADVLDALLSDRVYRPSMPVEEAIGVIEGGRGSHFDPAVVDALLENLDEVLALRG